MSTEDSPAGQLPQATKPSRVARLWGQIVGRNPFGGNLIPGRVPLIAPFSRRPSLPFPHPWNYRDPIRILDTYFWDSARDSGPSRHNRYLDVPGFSPVLVTRDPRVIRAISAMTSDQPGHFDRDTLPTSGIARATGEDTLLYANGPTWKRQKKLATPPFARTTLFEPEQFGEFEQAFRRTVRARLAALGARLQGRDSDVRVSLEPEIKAVMLEMLVNCFFGANIGYEQIRNRYVPALEVVIDHLTADTVLTRCGIPLHKLPAWTERLRDVREAKIAFEELTALAIAPRKRCTGLWGEFKSDVSDDALRANIRVFLAGALEATTSYASWAISHLARNPDIQTRLYNEVKDIDSYSPATLAGATFLGRVLEETLRLTPSLYFHPRRATQDTTIETTAGDTMRIPRGTHILLDIWHANRHEDHWGVAATGFPADVFAPDRWEKLDSQQRGDFLHFGFGHGPRFCPGKNLGQLEVALVVGVCVKLFEFEAVTRDNTHRAGVSTKPFDGVDVRLRVRDPESLAAVIADQVNPLPAAADGQPGAAGKCPFLANNPAPR